MSNGDVVFLCLLLLAVYLRLITVRLVTDLSATELRVGFRGLWRIRRVPLASIHLAKAIQYDPVADFGGYGIRSGAHGMGYIAHGNGGVQIELINDGKLLVGSQRPEDLAAKIMQAKNASNA